MVLFQFTHHENDWSKMKKKIGNIAGKIPKFYRKIVETSQKKDTRNTAHFCWFGAGKWARCMGLTFPLSEMSVNASERYCPLSEMSGHAS